MIAALTIVGGTVVQAQEEAAPSVSQLQAQIEALQQQVQDLQDQLAEQEASEQTKEENETERDEEEEGEAETGDEQTETQQGPPPMALSAMPSFARQRLQRGERGPAVRQLQEFLALSPQIYPEGLTTGYYGPLTSQAVKRLKERVGTSSDGSSIGPDTFRQVRTLLEEGAGQSGVIPPGLKQAPGLQRLLEGGLPGEGTNAGPGQFGPPADNGAGNRATNSEGAEDGQEQEEEKEREEQKERNEEVVASGTEAQTGQGPAINIDRLPIPAPQKQQLQGILQQFGGQSEVEFETEDGETETSADAQEAIADAEEEIAKAEKDIAEEAEEGGETEAAENRLEEAKDKLAEAKEALSAGNNQKAATLAKAAEDMAGEARMKYLGKTEAEINDGELEIEAEAENGKTEVKVKYKGGSEENFTFDTTSENGVVTKLVSETDLTKSEVEKVIEFEAEEDNEDEDEEDNDESSPTTSPYSGS